jgi:hypothetical protein
MLVLMPTVLVWLLQPMTLLWVKCVDAGGAGEYATIDFFRGGNASA